MRVDILLLLIVELVSSNNLNNKNKAFLPTTEWKEINEGQTIPPGLHVRINLQTGKKEAKLLDPNEHIKETASALSISDVLQDTTTQDDTDANHLRLKEALKNIPDEGIEYSEERLKEITKKIKSYEKIQKKLADMDMAIKMDFELMSDLFKKYETIKGKKDIPLNEFNLFFDDMEYLLHQIDNANDFVSYGGLETIIIPNLQNQSIPELRIRSGKLLGVLMQNNPKGQIAAFEKNVGSLLLHLLSQSNSNVSTSELSSIIFALGGLLRKFPLAQEELLNKPGLNILVDLLSKNVDYKIKIKCSLLISDLIRDYNEVTGTFFHDDVNKTKQYQMADIMGRLSNTEYCAKIDDLIRIHRPDYLESLYTTEDILNVLIKPLHDGYQSEVSSTLWEPLNTFWAECYEACKASSQKRAKQIMESRRKFQQKILVPWRMRQTEEFTRLNSQTSTQKMQDNQIERRWKTMKRFLYGQRGAWCYE